jgi:hypothetical protein
MDLSTFKFPEVTKGDFVFPTFDTIKELLEEAEKRNPKKGMDKFDKLFYEGGEIRLQEDVKGTWKEKAYLYARALMGSWSPKHKHKQLVVGMIFEEVLVLK